MILTSRKTICMALKSFQKYKYSYNGKLWIKSNLEELATFLDLRNTFKNASHELSVKQRPQMTNPVRWLVEKVRGSMTRWMITDSKSVEMTYLLSRWVISYVLPYNKNPCCSVNLSRRILSIKTELWVEKDQSAPLWGSFVDTTQAAYSELIRKHKYGKTFQKLSGKLSRSPAAWLQKGS